MFELAVSRLAPRVGRLPYLAALKFVAIRARRALRCEHSIWPRNSYLTSAFVPLISDLDLTVWFEGEPDKEDLLALLHLLQSAKQLFPFLGEANVYIASQIATLHLHANSFEIARDPRTEARLRELTEANQARADRSIQRTVFCLRMLEADLRNLHVRPRLRIPKWREHFRALDLPAANARDFFNWPSARDCILERALGEGLSDSRPMLNEYLDGRLDGVADHLVPSRPELACLFPHRFCFRDDQIEGVSETLLAIARAQIDWELWGIAAQRSLVQHKGGEASLNEHLARLKNLEARLNTRR